MSRSKLPADLEQIPSVGPRVAAMLREIGIRRVSDLRGRSAERLYARLCSNRREPVDRCVLYTFRCAVYFASESNPDPERLKWWNWKNSTKS